MTKDQRQALKGIAYKCYALVMPPAVGKPPTTEQLEAAYKTGMIPKNELQDGVRYLGTCRNADEAIWYADKQRFTYIREKFGSTFPEDIVCPEDDIGFDVFCAVAILE